jgi:glycosyltransferase involved in cell wall biosynthesis
MSERLRLLFVPHAYAPALGGTELLCQRVAESAAAAGHDVRVLTTDAGSVDAYYQLGVPPVRDAAARVNGVDVVRVPLAAGLYAPVGALATSLPSAWLRARLQGRALQAMRAYLRSQFRREIDRFQPDVVVTMPHLVVNVEAVLDVHRDRPFPLVLLPMLHEHDAGWDADAVRHALRQADAVVALTANERERLVARYGVHGDAVFVGGMGVDLPASNPAETRSSQAVVFLGRKAPDKGILLLLDAMQAVWRTAPDARLVLAGARGAASGAIDERIASLPPDQRALVSSEDNVSDARKRAILDDAACLVLPSRVESFGGVILEAWAHGAPAVALDLPVFRDVVDAGVNGLLASPDDPDALGAAIAWMLEHRDQAAAMGRAGYQKARDEYAWPAVGARYVDACRHALRTFRARTGLETSTS